MKTMGAIMVDIQGDFTTWKKGALAVEGTDAAFIEKLRKACKTLKQSGHAVFATQDWHPTDHISFYTNHPGRKPFDVVDVRNQKQVLWPPHCVQGTENAKLLLAETLFDAVVKKGKDRRYDSYSGFQDDGGARTEMDGLLKQRGIQELIVFGIATDYCVKATALDAAKAGYKVTVVAGLSRGVAPDTTATALEEMKANGITIRKEL
jgi:nicotinamidase/pyrazinamidase